MVTGLAIAGLVVAVISIIASVTFTILSARKTAPEQESDMSAATIDDVQATRTNEGAVVPVVYGTCRISGNIIWYANLINETTYLFAETASVSGFRYFLDLWQAICFGKVELLGVFVNNEKVVDIGVMEPNWTFLQMQFSDGETNTIPSQFFGDGPGEFINKLPGIAHIYLNSYLLGENNTVVPTIHFLVKRILETPLTNQNMDSGSNPAAVVWDLLKLSGVPDNKIDQVSFQAAADFWFAKDYGINFSVNSITQLQDLVKRAIGGLDGILTTNTDGKFIIKIKDPDSDPVDSISDDDYIDFKAKRTTYAQVANDFKATFKDEEQDYTTRTVVAQNQAAIMINENIVTEAIDLNIFTKVAAASKRLTEIMKNWSYPALEIDVETHLGLSELLPGDKVEVSNTKLGIISADFWITEINKKDLDKNEFGFRARQVTETLFDDIFQPSGGSYNVPQVSTLEEFDNVRFFELPYTSQYGFEVALLCLVNREKGFETSFKLQISQVIDSGYQDMAVFSNFSQAGFLAEEYPLTRNIDLEQGILYTPALKDPRFNTISGAELFTMPRYAIIGDEILAFQTVTNEGSDVRLTNVIRNLFNTTRAIHTIGQQIFLVNLGANVLQGIPFSSFYAKAIPQFGADIFDPSLVTPILVTLTNKAKKPRPPGYVLVTRIGSSITVEIWPNTPDIDGFGNGLPSIVLTPSSPPYPFNGDFLLDYETGTLVLTTTSIGNFTKSGAFTLTINARRFNLSSEDYTVSVGATDGEYS